MIKTGTLSLIRVCRSPIWIQTDERHDMNWLLQIDRFLLGLIGLTLLVSVVIFFISPTYFSLTFAAEDRVVEYGTAIFLFVASTVLMRNAISLNARGLRVAMALTCLYALMFFLAAGEEISWGQRIFGWESSEFFQENNKQYETNLHNLVVGDVQLAKTLFGSGLTLVLLLYLVALPLLYPRVAWMRRLADKLAVPVPGRRHAAIALGASLIIAAMDVSRRWEVYELVFSLLAVSIFLLPQNRDKVT